MTIEEASSIDYFICNRTIKLYTQYWNNKELVNSDVMEYVNWCYKNHIDINNLVPMGLAIDATELNIY